MKYVNNRCPVCGLNITEKDDIVVCPDCGTPHHRECYNSVGHCVNKEKHSDGYEYKAKASEETVGTACSRCGEMNDSQAEVCKICGYPLKSEQDVNIGFDSASSGDTKEKQGAGFGFDYKNIRIQIPPIEGVRSDEEIDGVKASDMITCVGINANHYVPKFKKMSQHKSKVGWNWGAFIFSDIWFFFRKCYLQGIANLIINFSCISLFEWVSYLAYQKMGPVNTAEDYNRIMSDSQLVSELFPLSVFMFLILGLMLINRAIWAVFSNHIYKQTVIEKINNQKAKAKEMGATIQEQIMMIAASGGVNIIIPLLYFMFYPVVFQLIIPMLLM